MTVGELFAGIGGFGKAFEDAGAEIKWQVEIDGFCRAVLATHFPNAKRYEDICDVYGSIRNKEDSRTLAPVDVICAGVP